VSSRRGLTPVARETLAHVAREHRAGRWARARRHGERPSLASLHARGLVVRRPWRGADGAADAAYEYRLSDALAAAIERNRLAVELGRSVAGSRS
jgi:hypothetical protein